MVTPQSAQGHTGLTHHFLIFDIRALWRSGLSVFQYGLERFGRLVLLQSEKCGTERVNIVRVKVVNVPSAVLSSCRRCSSTRH